MTDQDPSARLASFALSIHTRCRVGAALQGSAPVEDNGALMYGPAALSGPIFSDAAANVCKALPPVGPALPENDQRRMGKPSPDVATALSSLHFGENVSGFGAVGACTRT